MTAHGKFDDFLKKSLFPMHRYIQIPKALSCQHESFFLIWASLAFIKFLYPNYNQFIKLENPLDGFSFFVLSSRHIQSRSLESLPHAEIAGGNILSERKRSISFADSRLGLQSFSNNRRSPDGMLLFSEIDFRFSTTVSRVKKSNRQSDFAVRQEVYAKADTPWTRKPGEGQA